MVTICGNSKNNLRENKSYILVDLRGLSTDDKPTKIDTDLIENGSTFIEIDTGNLFLYDLDNEEWQAL